LYYLVSLKACAVLFYLSNNEVLTDNHIEVDNKFSGKNSSKSSAILNDPHFDSNIRFGNKF